MLLLTNFFHFVLDVYCQLIATDLRKFTAEKNILTHVFAPFVSHVKDFIAKIEDKIDSK